MNTNKLKLALCALCGLALFPHLAAAYEVTDTSAIKLSDDTVLFTITYQFGFLNRDMLMPIDTRLGLPNAADTVGYEIRSGNTVITDAFAPAVILTEDENVTIMDGQYYLPRGKTAQFTLVGLLRLNDITPTSALSLAITQLPYTTINADARAVGMVREEELPEYRTPQLTILDGLTVTADLEMISVSEK